MSDAPSGSGADYTLTRTEFFALGVLWLDQRVQELVNAGQLTEAIGEYTQDIERLRAGVTAALNAGAVGDTRLDRAIAFRTAHAARNIGVIEALRVRVQPALDQTSQALETLRSLGRDHREPIVYDELIKALFSFAQVRALCRTQLAEAAEAIAVAVRMLDHLAAEGNDVSEEFRANVTRLSDAVAVEIAEDFYTALETGPAMLDPRNAARALHHAVRSARDRYLDSPALWAGYLHAGA